jgi:streptogramin lyase
MNQRVALAIACSGLAVMLSSCAGAGGSNNSSLPPQPSSSPPAPTTAKFVIDIPAGTSTQSSLRRPLDFSASTQSVTIALGSTKLTTANVTASSVGCVASTGGGRSCTIGVNAPTGNDQFTVTAYDQPDGKGTVLATGTVAATISSSSVATLNVAVSGVIVKLELALANPYPPAGTASSTAVVVSGLDADGNTVLGKYASPISLKNADTSGATSLSASSVKQSGTAVSLNYTGVTPFASTTVTASLAGVASVTATFVPTPQFTGNFDVPPVRMPLPVVVGLADIRLGPDGNMWAVGQTISEILKIAPSGALTTYPLPSVNDYSEGLVVGADGNLWFAENQNNAIGKMTTSGVVTEYPLPGDISLPAAVTLGKDGNVWFVDQYQNTFGKITTSGVVTEYPLPKNALVEEITTGPDGNLWMTDDGNNAIVKASTSGAVLASYAIPTAMSQPWGIASGSDGNVWFTEYEANKIGRVTQSGSFTEFNVPTGSAGPLNLAADPSGKRMWFSEMGNQVGQGKVGYVAIDGSQVRDYPNPTGYHVFSIAFDANGKLWFTSSRTRVGDAVGALVY